MRAILVWCGLAGVAAAAPVGPGVGRGPGVKGQPGVIDHVGQTTFLYAAYRQLRAGTIGLGAMVMQADPALGAGDAHSLAELAAISADQQQIVEIGWHVDPGVNGDVQPRLFVFHWIDGVPTCYDACDWVQVSTTRFPGMRVTAGEVAAYGITLDHGDWWLSYQGERIGYFPGTLWGGRFTTAPIVQWFGEVAAASATPCTTMGTGKFGGDPMAATMTALTITDAQGAVLPATAGPGTVSDPALYQLGQTTATSFGFGGPGAATGCCTPSTCLANLAQCGDVPDTCGTPLACGSCAIDEQCTAALTCVSVPAGDADVPGSADSGCCGAARGGGGWLPGLVVGFALLRRRRNRGC